MEPTRESKATRRIKAEYTELNLHPQAGIIAAPRSEDNIFEWNVQINGHAGTLTFPTNYPLVPPKLRFAESIGGTQVGADGSVDLPILHVAGEASEAFPGSISERWSPVQSVEKVLLTLKAML